MNKTDNIITRLIDKVNSNTDAINAIKRVLSIKSLEPQTSSTSYDEGTSDHTQLKNRDSSDQHPISAITGLTDFVDQSNDRLNASELELRGENDYYAAIKMANTAGYAGYLRIQPRKENAFWANTVLNPENGNVGIGTIPAQKLDVAGKLRLRNSSDPTKYVDIEVDAYGNLVVNGNVWATGNIMAHTS